MLAKIVHFLRVSTPWLAVIILWRLSVSFWNPAGLLALIPIFYYSFVRPTHYFVPFAILFCFLIDYKFETLAFWTAWYCLFYAVNGFQTFFDLTKIEFDAIHIFVLFFGLGMLVLLLANFGFINMLGTILIILWSGLLYIPITRLIKWVQNDR